MSESGEDGDSENISRIKSQIREIGYQGDLGSLQRLTEEGRITLDSQIESLNDVDDKAVSILRINVLLVGLLLTAGSFIANSNLELAILDNWAFYIGIISLLLSTSVASVTYTASASEVGIGGETINEVINADLSEKEFELAVAQSQIYWIQFNDKTNVINALLITVTNLLLIISLFHLAVGVYIGLTDVNERIIALSMWVVLIIVILSSNIIKQVREVNNKVALRELRPW